MPRVGVQPGLHSEILSQNKNNNKNVLASAEPGATLAPPPSVPSQVSELRQQLRLRGLPVSGTKSMLLERMRGGVPPRERLKQRLEDNAGDTPWLRLRPKALGIARRQGGVRAGLCACEPMKRGYSGMGRKSKNK